MASTVTETTLRRLARFRAANGCAVSLYLDLDPSSAPTARDVSTKFNAVLDQAEKIADARASDRDCRMALRDDLERIRAWWDTDFDRDGARGVAIFASSADGFFQALPLAEPAGDDAWINSGLRISPLLSQLGRDGDLVAVLSRERGTVYRFEAGRLVEIIDETEETPGQHDQGGWSQARYARHIEHLVQQHLKTVGSEIDRTLRAGGGLQMVMVAPEEMRAEIEHALSHEAREAIIGWTTAEAHAGPAQLLEAVRPLLDEARARHEHDVLARWEEARGRGERAAGGWKQTLDAASDARVAVLLVAENAHQQAWECPQCGRASADGGRCPLDDSKLEPVPDGTELAVRQTLLHGGSVVRLGSGGLAEASGIGALLRF
jgi:peptide chain release factor subunit 1